MCLPILLSFSQSLIYLPILLAIYRSLSIYLSICPSTCPSIYLSIYLSIYAYMHTHILTYVIACVFLHTCGASLLIHNFCCSGTVVSNVNHCHEGCCLRVRKSLPRTCNNALNNIGILQRLQRFIELDRYVRLWLYISLEPMEIIVSSQ